MTTQTLMLIGRDPETLAESLIRTDAQATDLYPILEADFQEAMNRADDVDGRMKIMIAWISVLGRGT